MRKIFTSSIRDACNITVDVETDDTTLDTLEQIEMMLNMLDEAKEFIEMTKARLKFERKAVSDKKEPMFDISKIK